MRKKEKTMKRICSIFLVFSLILGVSACSSDGTKEATQVVNQYYKDLQAGDFTKAQTLYTDDVEDGNGLSAISASISGLENSFGEDTLSDQQKTTINDSANAFMQTAMKTYVKKYSIVRTEIKKDKSIVLTVKVKGFDVNDFQNIDTNAIENSVAPKYEEQLNQVTSQEQAYDILSNMLVDLFSAYSQAVENLDTKAHAEQCTLVQQGNQWKIKKIVVQQIKDTESA